MMNTFQVLVVDDDPVYLQIMQAMLGQEPALRTAAFSSPLAALEHVRHERPDLVFLDMNMPEVTGVKFIARLAELRFRGKVVLISGHERRILESVQDYGRSLGVEILGSINKPVRWPDVQDLLRQAQQHKAAGIHSTLFATDHQLSAGTIRQQFGEHSIEVAYQPVYRMQDARIQGIEALARWKNVDHLLLPDNFMPAIYAEGMVNDLSLLVFRRLLRDLRVLHDKGCRLSGSINLSILSLADDDFMARLFALQAQSGVDWRHIIIEISEKQVFVKTSRYLDNMLALIFRGCRIAIDNFGAGSFALSLLRQVPFAIMKIDRSFVTAVGQDSRSSAILRNCTRLGLELGMQVVATGGESRDDWNFCREAGCDLFQGYFKSTPLLFEDLQTLVSPACQDTPATHQA